MIFTLDSNINLLTYCEVSWWNHHKRSIRITANSGHKSRVRLLLAKHNGDQLSCARSEPHRK